MALILPGMDGYTLATGLDADPCSLNHVGLIAASGIAQRSDLVNVDTKIDHVSFPLFFCLIFFVKLNSRPR
jgi:CheY-like chemotaxis protein